MRERPMTDGDKEALSAMPDGWFADDDRWSSTVNRPYFRLDRLVKAGLIQKKIEGEYPNHKVSYRKRVEVSGENI